MVPCFAQGTIAGQGFGYPVGQFSARTSGVAGAFAPFDHISPVNPAALSGWQQTTLFFHVEPEYRRTTAGTADVSTNVSRFPLAGAGARVFGKGAIGLTASSYLDRTWETVSTSSDDVGGETVEVTNRYASDGAINDVRFAAAWAFTPALQVGLGYHAYTGENRLKIGWEFPDSLSFGDVSQESTLSYGGGAVSGGVQWKPFASVAGSAYARIGGSARLRIGDTLISRANMPDHMGFGVRYDGIAGTVVAAGWERVEWSAMRALGSADLDVRDTDRISAGAETRGPSIANTPVFLRAGFARRTLPFAADGHEARETILSFGAGYLVARGRANIDLAVQRARRTAGDVRENAWMFSVGLAITP